MGASTSQTVLADAAHQTQVRPQIISGLEGSPKAASFPDSTSQLSVQALALPTQVVLQSTLLSARVLVLPHTLDRF